MLRFSRNSWGQLCYQVFYTNIDSIKHTMTPNITHSRRIPGQSSSTAHTDPSSSNLSPAAGALANTLIHDDPQQSPFFGIDSSKLHELLHTIAQHSPYVHMAIQESFSHSKTYAPLKTVDILPQFFRAKTAHQLPSAKQVLEALNLPSGDSSPAASNILTTLIDRHIPSVIENTLAHFEQTRNPTNPLSQEHEALGQLITFIHTLTSHPAAKTKAFWQHQFGTETLHALQALLVKSSEFSNRFSQTGKHLKSQDAGSSSSTPKAFDSTAKRIQQTFKHHKPLSIWYRQAKLFWEFHEKPNACFPEQCGNDRLFMLTLLTHFPGEYLSEASPELQNDKEIVLAAVNNDETAFEFASENLQADPQIVLAAVQNEGYVLELVNENFRADHNIVLSAVSNNGHALQFASNNLRADRDIVLSAVSNNGSALQFASENLRSDRKIVLAAVSNSGTALRYTNANLRADRHVVRAAVENDGFALSYANQTLRSNRDIVLAACNKGNFSCLPFVGEDLLADRDFFMDIVHLRGRALKYANPTLRADPAVVLTAINNDGKALEYASKNFSSDQNVVLTAVKNDGAALKYASEDLRNEHGIVLAAVKNDKNALAFASLSLQNNRDIVMQAIKTDGRTLRYASKNLRANPEIVLAAIRNHGAGLEYASKNLRADPDIVLAAVTNKGTALQYATENMSSNREIVLAAVKQDGLALRFASKNLCADREIILSAIHSLKQKSKESGDSSLTSQAFFLLYASTDLKIDTGLRRAAGLSR